MPGPSPGGRSMPVDFVKFSTGTKQGEIEPQDDGLISTSI